MLLITDRIVRRLLRSQGTLSILLRSRYSHAGPLNPISRAIDLIRERVPNLPQAIYESHKLPWPAISAFPPAPTSVADVRAQTTRSTPTAPSALGSYPELPSLAGVSNVQNLSSATTSQGSTGRAWKIGRSSSPVDISDITAIQPDGSYIYQRSYNSALFVVCRVIFVLYCTND
ncbi:hypothetical protein EDB19DRAFT_504279 [Suillus lakei]|nr:hypothetical protein EDB19DRAFT_504279 [Suillus lakei]